MRAALGPCTTTVVLVTTLEMPFSSGEAATTAVSRKVLTDLEIATMAPAAQAALLDPLRATAEALADAGIETAERSIEERRSIGVEIGTGGGGFAFTEKHYEYWFVGPKNKASVYIIPASTHGGLSSEVSMAFGFRGLSHVVSTG